MRARPRKQPRLQRSRKVRPVGFQLSSPSSTRSNEQEVNSFCVPGLAADATADGLEVYKDDWSLDITSD